MANATFIQDGNAIDYTPGADVAAGDVVVQGELVGVAKQPISASVLGSLSVAGVFDFPKATGSGEAITTGAKVYWDDASDVATATAGSNKLIGKAIAAAAADDETVRVRMSQ